MKGRWKICNVWG